MENPYSDQKCHVMMFLGNLVYFKLNKITRFVLKVWEKNERENIKGIAIFNFQEKQQ